MRLRPGARLRPSPGRHLEARRVRQGHSLLHRRAAGATRARDRAADARAPPPRPPARRLARGARGALFRPGVPDASGPVGPLSGIVVVTGAAGGLGRVYCRGLAAAGWTVVAADLVEAEVDGASLSVAADVTNRVSTEALAAAALDAFGQIDALVNNAGYYSAIVKKPFDELDDDEWDQCFAVNVRGSWLCARAVAPTMKAQRGGKIVN